MIGKVVFWIKALRFIPSFICVKNHQRKEIIEYEVERWSSLNNITQTGFRGFFILMMVFPEFRSLVYHRTGCKWLRHFGTGQTNLYFHTPADRIGRGLMIWHGYSTVINADSIGENCSIWHNVTIGKKSILPIDDKPVIGDNVNICTGSIVIGKIRVENGSTIGAGSIVLENINEKNSIVVGVKAKVIS